MSLSLALSLRFRLSLLGVNLEPTFDIKEPMVKKPTKPRKPDTLMLQKRSRIDAMKQIKSLRSNKENISSNKKHDDGDDVPVRDNEQQGGNNESDSFTLLNCF